MKLRWTLIPQFIALGVQVLLPVTPDFPQQWVPFMHGVVSFLQLAQAAYAHEAEPNSSAGRISRPHADEETESQSGRPFFRTRPLRNVPPQTLDKSNEGTGTGA